MTCPSEPVSGESDEPTRVPLPGIVSPLAFSVDFACNSQRDAVSITMGNGRLRLARESVHETSGPLHLSLQWSFGFRAHALVAGVKHAGWRVDLVTDDCAELSRTALTSRDREAQLPMVTVVKLASSHSTDEFVARVWGEAPDCRGASLRGWSRR
jgi:hypothetical protein